MDGVMAVVLAAGKGERMKSEKSKMLHTAAGKPLIGWVVDALHGAGVRDIVAVLGHKAAEVAEFLGPEVKTAVQEGQKGTAHAVNAAREYFENHDGYVLLMPGDMPLYTPQTIRCVAEAAQGCECALLTARYDDPSGYGRIIRNSADDVLRIVEQPDLAGAEHDIKEANAFLYCVRAHALCRALDCVKPNPRKGEYYLTDIVEIINAQGGRVAAVQAKDAIECLGVNDRFQLWQAQKELYLRIARRHMLAGVTVMDAENTYIDDETRIGCDTVVYPGVILERSVIGSRVTLYQGSRIAGSRIGDGSDVQNSVVLQSEIGQNTTVGPYAYLRPGTKVGDGCRVGDFVEIKNSTIDDGTKISHLTYVGDSDLGKHINIGCGVVFVNYDGKEKFRSRVDDRAFIGCNTNLVSPVTVGEGAYIAAGTTVTDDVPPASLCIGRSRQTVKRDWKDKRRK